jgi:hypothetical protein
VTEGFFNQLMSLVEPSSEWGRWMLGVAMMTVALFLGAQMGVFQEGIFKKYGNYPKEALYYTVKKTSPNLKHVLLFTKH